MKVLIVDDEANARENLKIILEDFFEDIDIVGFADNVWDAAKIIEVEKPALVFLDINMPEADGFQLFDVVENRNFEVIFITAHSEYALKALKESAIDYLEKPLNIEDLSSAIEKAREKLNLKSEKALDEQQIMEIVKKTIEKPDTRLSIPTRDGLAIVDHKDIIHLEATEGYTYIHLSDGRKFLSSKNIRIYEEKLNDSMFFRIHKSHIINIALHLKEFSRKGGNVVVLSNDREVPVSRRKLSTFLEKIASF